MLDPSKIYDFQRQSRANSTMSQTRDNNNSVMSNHSIHSNNTTFQQYTHKNDNNMTQSIPTALSPTLHKNSNHLKIINNNQMSPPKILTFNDNIENNNNNNENNDNDTIKKNDPKDKIKSLFKDNDIQQYFTNNNNDSNNDNDEKSNHSDNNDKLGDRLSINTDLMNVLCPFFYFFFIFFLFIYFFFALQMLSSENTNKTTKI